MTTAPAVPSLAALAGLPIDPGTPWCLAPGFADAVHSALAAYQPQTLRAMDGESAPAFAERCDSWTEYCQLRADASNGLQIDAPTGLAVQPVCGTIVAGASGERELYCGLFDLNRIASACSRAATDDSITALVFVWDSPGGYCAGITATLAALSELRALRPSLPVLSYVPRQCLSLAYWIACGTQEIHANSDAQLGSIGSYIVTQDTREGYLAAGVDVRILSSGQYKGMGTPGAAWDPAWYAELQSRVATTAARFTGTVRANRPGVSEAQMTGLSYEAQSAGALVDSTAFPSLPQFLAAVLSQLPARV